MRYRCHQRQCGSPPKGFEFEADVPLCPKCNAAGPPLICELCDVHFIVMDVRGPILGSMGRQYIACQPRRDYLATMEGDFFSATDDPRAVSCASCRGTPPWRDMAKLFPELRLEMALAAQSGGMRVLDPRCGSC